MAKPYKWTVEFTVDPSWVADGFDLTDERAAEMIASALPYTYNWELTAKVIAAPDADKIAREQGYKNTKDMLATR